MSQVLIIDDEPTICWTFEQALTDAGHDVHTFASAETALEELDGLRPDVVLLDVRLPGMSGLEALGLLRQRLDATPVILMTAFGSLDVAVQAITDGAFDYLPKPFDLDAAVDVVSRALAVRPPSRVGAERRAADAAEIIGRSRAMQEIFRQVALVAREDVPVLITGESGVGKELVARAIHQRSAFAGGAFVPICMPALSPQLIESELFGHVRGAFTGAERDRTGLLQSACGGTAFFDEIGEVPLLQQVKLLRILDDKQLTPVGSSTAQPASFRLIAATNRSLEQLVDSGGFRDDLYYRLRVFPIQVPPLRERRDDIPELARHFLLLAGGERHLRLSDSAMAELQGRHWYGNVRELRAAMQYAAVVTRGELVTPDGLPPSRSPENAARDKLPEQIREELRTWAAARARDSADLYLRFLEEFERPVIDVALEACGGNRSAAAELLGLHRETLRKKLGGK
ncbi:MAG: sigma-54-dependent Fis family transcriptional regulator [Planctomycetaceae bacterium]|nr:sigma-54-dependent Fis family transcriptional regulator [Planctomycetaceae bacterium]